MVEANIELTVVSRAEKGGWWQRKMKWLGRDGAQDRIFIKDGRVVFMEFKDRGKAELAPGLQKNNRKAMQDHGAECHVVDTIVEGCRILGV